MAITWLAGKRGVRTVQKFKHSWGMRRLRTRMVQICGGDHPPPAAFCTMVAKKRPDLFPGRGVRKAVTNYFARLAIIASATLRGASA